MANPLTMKLEQFARFDQTERERLNGLLAFPTQTFAPREVIIKEGKKVHNIHLVLTGMAARSKTLASGERQLMALLIPGDMCDLEVFVLEGMDHDIVAVSQTTCVLIPAQRIEELLTESSGLTRALWWSTMVDSAILREWIVDNGSREARERLAHLFYELLVRCHVVGETTDDAMPFPLTQEELGQATGMTSVHVNRTIQQMRKDGLIQLENKVLTVLDRQRLREVAKFEANYLHLVRTEQRDPEVFSRAGDLIKADGKV